MRNMIDINKDLEEAVQRQLAETIKSDFVEDLIKKNIQTAIKEAVEVSFRSYSPIGEQLRGFLKENFKFDFSEISLADHNSILLDELKEALESMKDKELKSKAKALIHSFLQKAPEKVSITEIVEKYKEYVMEKYSTEIEEQIDIDEYERLFDIDFSLVPEGHPFYKIILKTGLRGIDEKIEVNIYSSSENSCIRSVYRYTGSYCKWERLGARFNLRNWHSSSEFEKFLYAIDKNSVPIFDDHEKVDPTVIVEVDCSC